MSAGGYGYGGFTLGGKTQARQRPQRPPDRRRLLRVYLMCRFKSLWAEMDGMRIGHAQDAARYALLEAREDELRRLCKAVSIDPDTCDWVPLRSGSPSGVVDSGATRR